MTPEEILRDIGKIRRMVQGKISTYTPLGRDRKYYNLSSYVGGKRTTQVRKDQILPLQALLDEHKRFRDLVKQYEEAIIERTRAELGLPIK